MSTVIESRLITAAEFERLELDIPAERVRGEIVEMTSPGSRHGTACINVGTYLKLWARSTGTHAIAGNDSGVVTTRDPDSVRGPDLLVLRKDRLPQGKSPAGHFQVAPDLVVEVLSPQDRWSAVLEKITEYFSAGVLEVWIVDPEDRTVTRMHPGAALQMFHETETLVSESVLPGFSQPVAAYFEDI